MEMKSIESYRGAHDLERFGVLPLTGEACGLAMRVLCDLTQEGCELWKAFTNSTPTADAWNRTGVKSIMVPYSMLEELWLFAQIREGKALAVFKGGYARQDEKRRHWTAFAIFDQGELENLRLQEKLGMFFFARTYKTATHPHCQDSLRNTHQMTGRTV
jgi:hypothetical protein